MDKLVGLLMILAGVALPILGFVALAWLSGLACAFGTGAGQCPPMDMLSLEAVALFWAPLVSGVLIVIAGWRMASR